MKTTATVTRYIADVSITPSGVIPVNQHIDSIFFRERVIYSDEEFEDIKEEFIERIARSVANINQAEEYMVKRDQRKTMRVWVVSDIT